MQNKIIDFIIGAVIGILLTVSVYFFFGSRSGQYEKLYTQAKENIDRLTVDLETTRRLNIELTDRVKRFENISIELSNSNSTATKQCQSAIEYNREIDAILEKRSK